MDKQDCDVSAAAVTVEGMPNLSGRKLMDAPVQFRAISLQQLRELRTLMQSLCKIGMLKERCGKPLSWTEVNMHHICHQVIKKVITDKCSWVEAQATRPQRPTYFVTHNWSEPFRDFMQAIDLHAAQNGVRMRQTYWICVFAMNQFNVDIGIPTELETSSPFISALKESKAAVLMLDKQGLALRRIWCLLEVFVVLSKYRELLGWDELFYEILTPVGIIGSKNMSSSPLMEALQNADSTRSKATFPEDRRLILNYLAFGAQNKDLLLGGLDYAETEQNSLKLQCNDCNKDGEYTYEASLFEQHGAKFKDFDQKIRDCVGTYISSAVHKRERRITHFGGNFKGKLLEMSLTERPRTAIHLRSMTLADLRVMAIKLEAETWIDKDGMPIPWEKVHIYDFQRKFMDHMDESWQEDKSTNANEPLVPDWRLNCSFSTTFEEFFKTIEWHAEARDIPESTLYWSWCTSLTTKDIEEWFASEEEGTPARDVIPAVQGVLNVLVQGVDLFKRINPLEELNNSFFKSSALCDLGCSSGVIASRVPFPSTLSYEFGTFDVSLCCEMLGVRTLDCTGANEVARKVGLNRIASSRKASLSEKVFLFRSQYNRLDRQIHRLASGPALRAAVGQGDLAEVQRIIELSSPSLKCYRLCSTQCSSPLMIAAAKGHVEIMKYLVHMGSFVDMVDSEGWTALHYASAAGQLEAVQYLISCGCSTDLVSLLEETPLDLAHANRAWFCGVDTQRVVAELSQAQHKLILLTLNMQYFASWPKDRHEDAIKRLGSVLQQDPSPHVICVQEGLFGTDVFSKLGYDLVVSSGHGDGTSQSVHDMVYGNTEAIKSLDESTRRAKLTNEIYVRHGCVRWELVDAGVELISSNTVLKGGGGRMEGKLAPRSVAWVQLKKTGEPKAPGVFVLCTHLTGGRFEDQYYLQSLQSERAKQIPRAMEPFYQRCEQRKDLGVLVGDFNAMPTYDREGGIHKYYEGAIMSSEGVQHDAREAGLDDEQMIERFEHYVTSPFTAIAEKGWKLAYNPQQVGPTSSYGETVDHVATSRVCTTHVKKFFMTNQRFGTGEPDTDLVLSDHNAVKVTIQLSDQRDMSRRRPTWLG